MGQKFFASGWKFNMFNQTTKQSNKAIAAVSVIFAQFFFSLASLITCQKDHQSLSMVVFTYCAICMFSYFNVTYVRDFDALQVNFTPLMLTVCGLVAMQRHYDFYLLGMVLSLIADSYFALRFRDNSDKITFSMLERFAMESWTQEAFNKAGQVTLQIVSVSIIFMQIFLTIVGTHNKEMLCFLFLTFYIVRLIQFLLKTSLAVNVAQSNLVCICLAAVGIFAALSLDVSLLTKLSCVLLVIDAFLGASLFIARNQEGICKELGVYKEFKNMQHIQDLNCQGHMANLNKEHGA